VAQQCSVCQQEFNCGSVEGQQSCWCAAYPPVMPTGFAKSCRCPACLSLAITEHINQSLLQYGFQKLVELAAPYRAQTELVEGIDYTTEDGNMVFSKWYHLKRGSCCGNGCRNCPYDKN
jgi:uncharacterized protein DUF5522